MKTNSNLYKIITAINKSPVRQKIRARRRNLAGLAVVAGLWACSPVAPAQTLTPLHTFTGAPSDGAFGGSLLVTNAIVYGGTLFGGSSSSGTVYKINTDGTGYQIFHSFGASATDGSTPILMGLIGSALYGVTEAGGSNNNDPIFAGAGTIFTINTDGTGYQVVHNFSGSPADGAEPSTVVHIGATLYGITVSGGSNDLGTIFTASTNGSNYQILHNFAVSPADGSSPAGLELVGTALYGRTLAGGSNSAAGTIFTINTDGTGYQILHNFGASATDGAGPGMPLVVGTTVYGVTAAGGSSSNGTLYKVNTDGSGYQILRNFAGSPADGARPTMLESAGTTLYGVTWFGGSGGSGTVYKINTDGSGFLILHNFTGGPADGAEAAGLVGIVGSTLYGLTDGGGSNGLGTVFTVNTAGTGYQILHNFASEGPATELTLVGSTIYGTTGSIGSGRGGITINPGILFTLAAAAGPASTKIIGLSGSLAFGSVATGTTPTTTLMIHNTGAAALTVTSISYPNGFSGAWNGTIPAGGSQAVTLTFTPTTIASYSGLITVNSDATSGTSTINVSGTGTATATVATPTITPDGGTFSNQVKVTLTCATAGATIRYTLVVAGPAGSSLLYKNAAITLTNSVTLTAQASKTIKNKIVNSGVATAVFTIIPPPPVTITTTSLPDGKFKAIYPPGVKVQATGGTLPYKWSITTGKLPAGLTLNATTGAITGKPTKTGPFNFTVKVTDAKKQTATQVLTLTIGS